MNDFKFVDPRQGAIKFCLDIVKEYRGLGFGIDEDGAAEDLAKFLFPDIFQGYTTEQLNNILISGISLT